MLEFKKRKKALSLVEMLVVLIIISTTVITAFGIILRSTIDIKENEVSDSINSLMVSINEAVKSPGGVPLQSFTPGTFTTNIEYAFKATAVGNSYVLTYVPGSASLTSCDSNSQFKFPISVEQSTVQDVCILVGIKLLSGTPTRYEVKTNTLYTFVTPNSSPSSSYLITYRYEPFTIN